MVYLAQGSEVEGKRRQVTLESTLEAFSISSSLTRERTGSIKGGDRNFGGKMKFTMMLLI